MTLRCLVTASWSCIQIQRERIRTLKGYIKKGSHLVTPCTSLFWLKSTVVFQSPLWPVKATEIFAGYNTSESFLIGKTIWSHHMIWSPKLMSTLRNWKGWKKRERNNRDSTQISVAMNKADGFPIVSCLLPFVVPVLPLRYRHGKAEWCSRHLYYELHSLPHWRRQKKRGKNWRLLAVTGKNSGDLPTCPLTESSQPLESEPELASIDQSTQEAACSSISSGGFSTFISSDLDISPLTSPLLSHFPCTPDPSCLPFTIRHSILKPTYLPLMPRLLRESWYWN